MKNVNNRKKKKRRKNQEDEKGKRPSRQIYRFITAPHPLVVHTLASSSHNLGGFLLSLEEFLDAVTFRHGVLFSYRVRGENKKKGIERKDCFSNRIKEEQVFYDVSLMVEGKGFFFYWCLSLPLSRSPPLLSFSFPPSSSSWFLGRRRERNR